MGTIEEDEVRKYKEINVELYNLLSNADREVNKLHTLHQEALAKREGIQACINRIEAVTERIKNATKPKRTTE